MTLSTFLFLVANHLWQSTVFAVAAGLLAMALRKNHARTRYWIWWIASLKFLIPFSLLVGLGGYFTWQSSSPPLSGEPYVSSVVIEQVTQPFTSNAVLPQAATGPSTTSSDSIVPVV